MNSNRPGASSCVVWSTDSWPIDNSGDDDPSGRKIGTTIDKYCYISVRRLPPLGRRQRRVERRRKTGRES